MREVKHDGTNLSKHKKYSNSWLVPVISCCNPHISATRCHRRRYILTRGTCRSSCSVEETFCCRCMSYRVCSGIHRSWCSLMWGRISERENEKILCEVSILGGIIEQKTVITKQLVRRMTYCPFRK